MKKLHDCTPNEIFNLLSELVASHNKSLNLRNVWFQADNYDLKVQKFKSNEVSISFMIKPEQNDLLSFTVKNPLTLDDFKKEVVKILKKNFL